MYSHWLRADRTAERVRESEEEPRDDVARRAQHGRFQRVALLRQSTSRRAPRAREGQRRSGGAARHEVRTRRPRADQHGAIYLIKDTTQ